MTESMHLGEELPIGQLDEDRLLRRGLVLIEMAARRSLAQRKAAVAAGRAARLLTIEDGLDRVDKAS